MEHPQIYCSTILRKERKVLVQNRVCVCFSVCVSRSRRYPFGVRRTPGFYLGGCAPLRAVFCLRTILFA
jgi:hypothetical protein